MLSWLYIAKVVLYACYFNIVPMQKTVGGIRALHAADQDLTPGTTYSSQTLPGIIPEFRARSKQPVVLCVVQKKKKKNKKKGKEILYILYIFCPRYIYLCSWKIWIFKSI